MKSLPRLFLLWICMLFSNAVFGQSDCENVLLRASTAYDNGKPTECIQLLNSCMSTISGKDEKIEAYRLLALSHQLNYETEKMHSYIAKLLLLKPDYALVSLGKDPKEFTLAVNEYEVLKKWSVGLYTGVILNQVSLIENHQAFTTATSTYQLSASAGFGFLARRSMQGGLSLTGKLGILNATVRHELEISGTLNQEYLERIRMSNLDIGLGYNLKLSSKWAFQPCANIGVGYVHKSEVNVDLSLSEQVINQFYFDQTERRNRVQPYIGIGGFIEYQTTNSTIRLGCDRLWYMQTTIKKDELYRSPDFNLKAKYNNDLLKLKQTVISLSYLYPIQYSVRRKLSN